MKRVVVAAMLVVVVSGFSRTGVVVSGFSPTRVVVSGFSRTVSLSNGDIDDALRLGRFGEPAPYLLRAGSISRTPPTGGRRGGTGFAAIYTPFVRVAFASRQAWDAGHTLEAGDLDASLLEPVVFVAFGWFVADSLPREVSDPLMYPYPVVGWTPFPMVYGMPTGGPGSPPFWKRATPPLWSKVGADALKEFGAPPPFGTRTAAVAAFPLSALRANHAFVIYKEYLKRPEDQGYSTFIHHGAIWADDLRTWR